MFNLQFDSHFVFCSYQGECLFHFGFFHSNLPVRIVYFWSIKLLQLNRIIVNMFSGILIVTTKLLQLNRIIVNMLSGILIVTVNI